MYFILKALFVLTVGEAVALMALFFETPIQEWILVALNGSKRGRALLLVRGILFSLVAVFLHSVYSSTAIIRRQTVYSEPIHWPTRVNLTHQILQALLAGFSIFISVMIKKTYNLIKDQHTLEETIKDEEKRLKGIKICMARQRATLLRDVTALTEQMKRLELYSQEEAKRVEAANARASALKNQLHELHLKYNKLLEYNETIQNQLLCINRDLQNDKDSDEKMCNMLYDDTAAKATNCCRHRRPICHC